MPQASTSTQAAADNLPVRGAGSVRSQLTEMSLVGRRRAVKVNETERLRLVTFQRRLDRQAEHVGYRYSFDAERLDRKVRRLRAYQAVLESQFRVDSFITLQHPSVVADGRRRRAVVTSAVERPAVSGRDDVISRGRPAESRRDGVIASDRPDGNRRGDVDSRGRRARNRQDDVILLPSGDVDAHEEDAERRRRRRRMLDEEKIYRSGFSMGNLRSAIEREMEELKCATSHRKVLPAWATTIGQRRLDEIAGASADRRPPELGVRRRTAREITFTKLIELRQTTLDDDDATVVAKVESS